MITLFQHNAFEIAHVVLQATDTLLSAPLRLGEFLDALLGTPLCLGEFLDALLGTPLCLGEFLDALLGTPLCLSQVFDALLSTLLRLSQVFDALLSTLLRLGQVAHYLGEGQQLLGQHEPAEFCPPLGVLLKNPDEIVEILDRESHNASALGHGNCLKAQQGNESILYGHSPRQVWPAWQVLQSC